MRKEKAKKLRRGVPSPKAFLAWVLAFGSQMTGQLLPPAARHSGRGYQHSDARSTAGGFRLGRSLAGSTKKSTLSSILRMRMMPVSSVWCNTQRRFLFIVARANPKRY